MADPLKSFTLIDRNPACVLLGRFKFKEQMDEINRLFTKGGIDVLVPKEGEVIVVDGGGYKFLEGDVHDPWALEKEFLEKISISDFVYIVNPDGSVGDDTMREWVFAESRGLPVYAMEPVVLMDFNTGKEFITGCTVVAPFGMVKMIQEGVIHIGEQHAYRPRLRRHVGALKSEWIRDWWEEDWENNRRRL